MGPYGPGPIWAHGPTICHMSGAKFPYVQGEVPEQTRGQKSASSQWVVKLMGGKLHEHLCE